ncbi:TonB-dependent receptor [Thaumasiovibrio subtropicus]|uniref:TonB-dependent receptor n=1 Tax=Thaumasiovibrio subtropicus TaxID=1891207 RepID=UPI000B35A22C|nr:TonB-dependent receptor [Thaumasiovibrio subtropicus]
MPLNNKAPTHVAIAIAMACLGYADHSRANEVIVVEATKLGTPIGQVDSSVVVKTGEELARAGVTDVSDLEKVFPGLVIQSRGNRTYANTTVRGVTSPDFYSSTVTVYVDGIKQDNAFLTQPLRNVERVELLRGPQGTLYGGNAQGGIIHIVTRKAVDQPLATTSVTLGDKTRQLDGGFAVQVSKDVYADMHLRALKEEGEIRHLPSGKGDANESDTQGGTIRVHYLPESAPLTATFSMGIDDLDSHEEWYLLEQEYDAKQTLQPIPELKRKVKSYAVNIGYEWGDHQLTSITAYQDREVERTFIGGHWEENQKTYSQELRFVSQLTPVLQTLIGAYAERRRFDVDTNGVSNEQEMDNYAIFGQGVYSLNESVDLTLGLRGEKVKSRSDYSGHPLWQIPSFHSTKSDTLFSPKVAIGWQKSRDTRLYASLTTGHRPGGYSPVPRSAGDSLGFDAEESLNAEVGWRTALLNHTLFLEGAVYWIETKDLQLYTGVPGQQVLRNHGEAQSKGVELAIMFYPTEALIVNLGGAFGESRFESGNPNLEGNTLPYAPDTTITASVEYFLPDHWLQGDLSMLVNGRYQSKIHFDEGNTLSQSGYGLFDLALNYDFDDRLSFRLYGHNVGDKSFKTFAFSTPMGVASNYGQGREVGVTVNLDW